MYVVEALASSLRRDIPSLEKETYEEDPMCKGKKLCMIDKGGASSEERIVDDIYMGVTYIMGSRQVGYEMRRLTCRLDDAE